MTERLNPYEIFAEDGTEIDVPALVRPATARGPAGHREPTSAAERQRTCAACGGAFEPGQRTEVEVLLDGEVRYLAVHPGHSTCPPAGERTAAARLHRHAGSAPESGLAA